MKYLKSSIKFLTFFLLVTFSINWVTHKKVTIYLVADSTMANKKLADNPERGWGQMFPIFFNENVKIVNAAKNGRSTKSFIDEGRWKAVYEKLESGDYVFIQFGHNDEKKYDTTRYTQPFTTFENNLKKFVTQSREKGAIPILLTPVNRRKFNKKNQLVDTHGNYTKAVRNLAKAENVPLIDLYNSSKKLFNKVGPEGTKKIFDWVPAGEYKVFPKGRHDNTHFCQQGAIAVAGLVVDGIEKLNLPLVKYLKTKNSISEIGKGKVVGLDYYYNDEWKTDKKTGKKYRYHYIWEDKTNSGYHELGKTITKLDGQVSEIKAAPTAKILSKLSIYIIVDPDTPKETEHPHYIEQLAIKNIVEWVKQGGVLVLFANDKGNSEFKHLNKLAENFGLHFNEVSRNDVKDHDFAMGKFDHLPNHPIFKGVKQIYLKEISTLKLSGNAKPILIDKGDVIMASSKVGNGFVFAVGDPWLYNEYFDNRKLPVGYENYKAGKNLFSWLLAKAKAVHKN